MRKEDIKVGEYYTVTGSLKEAPLRDHLLHGYEEREDFRRALRDIVERWRGRYGECIGERNGFLHLRFHDTPGGMPDEAHLPCYLVEPCVPPEYARKPRPLTPEEEFERELDRVFWPNG